MDFSKGWLDYKELSDKLKRDCYYTLFIDTEVDKYVKTAIDEYEESMGLLMGAKIKVIENGVPSLGCVTIQVDGAYCKDEDCSYVIGGQSDSIVIKAKDSKLLITAIFDFIRRVRLDEINTLPIKVKESMPIRILNHWDNMDGSIERGYSGRSFFFDDYNIIHDERVEFYARLIASVGINAVVINNVNVHENETYLVTDRYLEDLRRYYEYFDKYGIKLFISVNFAAPMELCHDIDVSDPLDERVIAWWERTVKHIYDVIPGFGGFLVKADSEGRPGPFTYGRTHADGANMLAKVIKPYGGLIIWRCFVYNCTQDWRDKKTDRARAAYDHFKPLDGEFMENVILQIKNGPMDFQIREPVSPLFGALKATNIILEVQIAQEYTGQQIDLCYLLPMWKEVLSFDTFAEGEGSTVERIVSGKQYNNINAGMAGVTNTGNDFNWCGNDLALANLYGFGRIAFDSSLSSKEIADEWSRLTFGDKIYDKVSKMLCDSRESYEKYNAPLGIGWMVTPHYHYGPDIDGYEYDRWGTYHRADCTGIGVDRTSEGTGYTTQYNSPWSEIYADKEKCPTELLLFFHRILYKDVLPSGKTLIQHIYDTHFEGVEDVEGMIKVWESLKDEIEEDTYKRVLERFFRQLDNAKEWRDRVNTYFFRKSGIGDEKGRTIY
ncbi:MAG: alpha-glucuronidase [Eubacterium sp.]|nr:alpha-glucuronidase [Eubacterium sp.]